MGEPFRRGRIACAHALSFRHCLQLRQDTRVYIRRLREAAAAEAQPHHRMALGPVVAGVDVQPHEQLLAALEQFLQCIQEQALAEPAGPRQEVVLAFIEQALDVGRLVDIVAVLLAQLAEGLHADRQSAFRHQPILPHRVAAQNRRGRIIATTPYRSSTAPMMARVRVGAVSHHPSLFEPSRISPASAFNVRPSPTRCLPAPVPWPRILPPDRSAGATWAAPLHASARTARSEWRDLARRRGLHAFRRQLR